MRPLDEEEKAIIQDLRNDSATMQAITLTVSQMDKVQETPETKPKVAEKPAPAQEVKVPKKAEKKPEKDQPEEVAEPTVSKSTKTAAAPVKGTDLTALVNEWDD